MFLFLLSAGILITVVGCGAVGYGIPINGFDTGNTLIMAGTTCIASGLVLIGLAACFRELRRLSDALAGRGARPARGPEAEAEALGNARGAGSPRMAYPGKADAPREAMLGGPLAMDEPNRGRPNILSMGRNGESPPIDEPEVVPLAPTRGPAAPIGRTPAGEAPYEPKFGPADILARLGSGRTGAPRPQPSGERAGERGEAAPPDRQRGAMFESSWPPGGKPGRSGGPDTIPRIARSEPDAEPDVEPRERFEPPPLRSEPPPLRSEPPPLRSEPPPMISEPREARPAADRTVSILKSGVIDGMAYTLYTDGSIEAQLPQGTMRFSSIEELRTHLESQGG